MADAHLDAVAVAQAFTRHVNARDHAQAAELLSEDVELVFPGATLRGRQAWLESRARQQPPEHLTEEVVGDDVMATADGAVLTGRMVQRWKVTGEVANEMPVRIALTVDGGVIRRLEFHPL